MTGHLDDAAIARQLGVARQMISDGRADEARTINAGLLASHPRHPGVLVQASRLESLAGHYRSARQYALNAFANRTGNVNTLMLMVSRLQAFHLNDQIQVLVDELLKRPDASVAVLDTAAKTLNQLNQTERAAEVIERALQLHPGSAELLVSRAQSRLFLGQFEAAEQDIAASLKLRPQNGFAWWLRAKLRRQTPLANHVAELQGLVDAAKGGDARNLALLAFALHKELDDLGEYPRAAAALDLACRSQRSLVDHDAGEAQRMFEALASSPIAPPAAGVPGDRTPVFIVGMHRSGTTLLEQLLGGHSQVRGLGELYEFTSALRYATDYACKGVMDRELATRLAGVDLAAVGRDYLDAVAWRLGPEPVFTDKLPSNFLNVGAICPALPQARILHMVRDPMETGFSNLRELFGDNTNPYAYDPAELGAFHRGYEQLMAHWHRAFPGRILDVHYERLTRDPEATMREVAQFCGLAFEPAMAQASGKRGPITTASAVQARAAVTRLDQPKWKPYAGYLAPLAQALKG